MKMGCPSRALLLTIFMVKSNMMKVMLNWELIWFRDGCVPCGISATVDGDIVDGDLSTEGIKDLFGESLDRGILEMLDELK